MRQIKVGDHILNNTNSDKHEVTAVGEDFVLYHSAKRNCSIKLRLDRIKEAGEVGNRQNGYTLLPVGGMDVA